MGYGAYIIERELREAGIKGPEGKPISVSSIKRILRNQRYRGMIVDEEVFDKGTGYIGSTSRCKKRIQTY